MTTRTAEVETERVVTETRELTICDGCGREVDANDQDVDVWDKRNGDETVHVGPNCDVEDLTRDAGVLESVRTQLALRSFNLSKLRPASSVGTAAGLVMAGIPLALHVGGPSNVFSAVFLGLLLIGWAAASGLAMLGVADKQDEETVGGEGLLIPLVALLGVFAAPVGFGLAVSIFTASFALQFAYYMARYEMP